MKTEFKFRYLFLFFLFLLVSLRAEGKAEEFYPVKCGLPFYDYSFNRTQFDCFCHQKLYLFSKYNNKKSHSNFANGFLAPKSADSIPLIIDENDIMTNPKLSTVSVKEILIELENPIVPLKPTVPVVALLETDQPIDQPQANIIEENLVGNVIQKPENPTEEIIISAEEKDKKIKKKKNEVLPIIDVTAQVAIQKLDKNNNKNDNSNTVKNKHQDANNKTTHTPTTANGCGSGKSTLEACSSVKIKSLHEKTPNNAKSKVNTAIKIEVHTNSITITKEFSTEPTDKTIVLEVQENALVQTNAPHTPSAKTESNTTATSSTIVNTTAGSKTPIVNSPASPNAVIKSVTGVTSSTGVKLP